MKAILLLLTLFTTGEPKVIDGYPSKLSAYPGDSLSLHLHGSLTSEAYTVRLYDLSGAIVFSTPTRIFPQSPTSTNSYESGFNYRVTCRLKVPALKSGVYLWENHIPFIIKSRDAKITVVYSSNTANAYSPSGGKSLYGFNSTDLTGAQKVSFLRPIALQRHSEAFLRWLHKESVQGVGYISDMDLDDYKTFSKSSVLIIAGHSEYWTLQARRNFDRFVHSGHHAIILSGNTMWWQVRYNKSKDQLICYRNAESDPIKDKRLKTVNWCDPMLQYPIIASTGTDFNHAGYGVRYADKGWNGYKIITSSPLLEGTSLRINDIISCPSDEADGAPLIQPVNDIPTIDYQALGFWRVEIIGYDRVLRGGKEGIATWIVFKPTSSSGIVVNTASTDWCSSKGIGSNSDIQIITRTMIKKLFENQNVFTTDEDMTKIAN